MVFWFYRSSYASATGAGRPRFPVADSVAVASEADDLGVVDEPVVHGCRNDGVVERLTPAADGHGRDDISEVLS